MSTKPVVPTAIVNEAAIIPMLTAGLLVTNSFYFATKSFGERKLRSLDGGREREREERKRKQSRQVWHPTRPYYPTVGLYLLSLPQGHAIIDERLIAKKLMKVAYSNWRFIAKEPALIE
ncbi:hypothetical protein CCACVL1_29827 [Corchorus capsularis]|uniref:Uncharacterized protein n=1 Tax=Corchorus capsularis TaxID=210143 RepID=A0A1R3G048_COCAP|nr:hypothetical protein CCACVL1_29827 [Corchorus capsularis]